MYLTLKKRGRSAKNFREIVSSEILPYLDLEHDPCVLPVSLYKKSDTLFVLGSGSSINSITEKAWETISSQDSFGFNFWLYHDFVPTWYACEVPRIQRENMVLAELLNLKKEDYSRTAFLLKDAARLGGRCPTWTQDIPLKAFKNIYTLQNLRVSGNSTRALRYWLKFYKALNYFKVSDSIWGVPMKRATLFMAISFGLMAGYKKIILCGIDLNNPSYFYYDEKYRSLPQLNSLFKDSEELKKYYDEGRVKTKGMPNSKIHNTMDPALNPMPMDEIIYTLNEEVLKKKGIQLFVALKSSALFPRIPSYFE